MFIINDMESSAEGFFKHPLVAETVVSIEKSSQTDY